VKEGPKPPLFGPWSFDNKAVNFVSVSTNLFLCCFHVFCGFLTRFGFPIICENINYFFKILWFIIFILFYFPCHVRRKHSKENKKKIQANLGNTYGGKEKYWRQYHFPSERRINTRLRLESYSNLETKGATTFVLVPRITG
jgi:hypothetical protein